MIILLKIMCRIFIILSRVCMILKFGRTACICFPNLFLNRLILHFFNNIRVVGTPASTNIRNAKYPQILPDNRVIFRIKAPDAQKVQIDLVKKYDMVKDTGGYWIVTTDSISEGFHYYSLID